MVTDKELVQGTKELAKTHRYVSADMVAAEFNVSLSKAYKVLQWCWVHGVLVPFTTSYFTLGSEPMAFSGGKNSSPKRSTSNSASLDLEEVRAIIAKDPTVGVSVWDIEQAMAAPKSKIRILMRKLVAEGEVVQGEASGPGPWAFGHRPTIWGVDEAAVKARDVIYNEDRAAKKADKKKSAVTPPSGTRRSTPEDERKRKYGLLVLMLADGEISKKLFLRKCEELGIDPDTDRLH